MVLVQWFKCWHVCNTTQREEGINYQGTLAPLALDNVL